MRNLPAQRFFEGFHFPQSGIFAARRGRRSKRPIAFRAINGLESETTRTGYIVGGTDLSPEVFVRETEVGNIATAARRRKASRVSTRSPAALPLEIRLCR